MIITILASIWCQNLWDELILKNEIKLLEKRYEWTPEWLKFIVFSYSPKTPFYKKENIEYKEYFPIWSKNILNIFRNIRNYFVFRSTIKKSDLVVLWWGWIIYDKWVETRWNPLRLRISRVNMIKAFKKKFMFFSVWLSIKNKRNNKKVKKIFSWAQEIVVRDNYSFELLEKLWFKPKRSLDPVFCDKKTTTELSRVSHFITVIEDSYLIKKICFKDFSLDSLDILNLNWKTVALALRSWYLKNEIIFINSLIVYIKEKWWKIILLPHSFHNFDNKSNDYLFLNQFADKYNLEITKNMRETYEMYKDEKIDLCLSMRLHSMILSQVYEIPFIGISYGKKTDELLSEIDSVW